MASPAASSGPPPSGHDTTSVADGSHTSNNKTSQSANEHGHYQPNDYASQNYGYSDGMNGIGNGMGARQWADYSAFGKLDGAQYMGGVNPGLGVGGVGGLDGYNQQQQEEANFVQNFAVQQPFLPYPYLTGFQPFGNQLYSQFGYGFGHPFADPNQFVDGGQAYFGMPDGAGAGSNAGGNATSDKNAVDGAQGGGEQQFFMDPLQLYQFGNAFANLSLHDPQDQQRLFHQQQLYQHQLLQLQQQHQQLQQQLLQTTHQLALQAGQQGVVVDGHDQAHIPEQQTTDSQQPQETQPQQEEEPLPAEEKNKEETQEDQTEEVQQPAQPPQKPKQEGPKSWADIINSAPTPKLPPQPAVKKQAFVSTAPTPSTTSTSSNSANANTAGALVVKPRSVSQENNHKADDLNAKKAYNPANFDYNVSSARFFVIKSYSEDDIHKSIKYNVWASTDSGNRRLDAAYRESATSGPIYLFYSVNASGQFCGMARMTSALDYGKKCELWAQDKWNGQFSVHWIFIKDIPNAHLRHIRLTNNENKPVTNSRDTQEIFFEPGREMLRLFTTYNSKTSILDDFSFYDKRQELMKEKKDLPDDTGSQKSDSSGGELLPIATGENRKQRGATSTTKVTSPPTQQSNFSSGGGSPQPHAKGTNGTTTTTTTTTTTATAKPPQRGKR